MIENRVNEVVVEVNKIIKKIKVNHFIVLKEIKDIPKEIGVYIIKNKGGDVFYVGSASKQTLFQRLGKNHVNGQGKSVLRKKLVQGDKNLNKEELKTALKINKERITNYLLKDCEYVIYPLTSFDKVLAVEYLLIFLLRKKFKLLNDNVEKFK